MKQAIRWSICIAACLLIAGGAVADDSYAIFGTVTTKSGAALEGVRVNVSGWLEAQVTDADGAFRVEGALPKQTYEVTPTLPGYVFKPEKRTMLVSSGDELANFVGSVADDGAVGIMSVTPAAAPPPASKAGPDAYEADNNWGMASGIGRHETQTHNIHANWDLDWTTFTLPWRANLVVFTEGAAGDTTLDLYGPDDHTLLAGFDDDSGDGDFSHMRWPPFQGFAPGRYWIRVQEDGQDATINSYTVTLDANEAPPCRLIYPNAAGITWELGSDQTIRCTGFEGDLVSFVLLKDGDVERHISDGTPNDGQFVWQVPPDVEAGTDYRVGIVTDTGDNKVAWSDNEFEIVSVPLVTYPSAAGISFPRGTEVTITWQGFTGPNVRIDVFQGGAYLEEVQSSTPNDGTWSDISPPDYPLGTNYKIQVTSIAHPAETDMSNHNFAIVANSKVTYPSDEGIVWRRDGSYAITWEDFTSPTVRIELLYGTALDRTLTAGTTNDGTFWWHVPADMPIGDNYRIRVSDPAKAPDDDASDYPFAVALPPKVLFPSAPGIEVGRGTNLEITWRGYSATHVKIDIYKGGVLGGDIIASTPNDGSYTVYTPDDAEIRDDYRIEVTSLAVPTETDRSNNDFAVVANPRVTYPTAPGIEWEIGELVSITWADFGGAEVRIQLYKGATLNRTITRGTTNDGSFVWRVPGTVDPDDNYRIEVYNTVGPVVTDRSDNQFTVEAGPHVIAPDGGEIWYAGDSGHITWERFPGANVKIRLYRGGVFARTISANTPNDGSFWWSVPSDLPNAANYRVRINAISGNTPNDGSFWWSVPNDLPSGDDYRIKINSTSHFGLVDRSNNDFEISP